VHSDADRTATTEAQLAAMRPLVDRLKELGATEHDSFDEMGSVWIVMQDPEGNEFCIT
jgi:hypothetical protein